MKTSWRLVPVADQLLGDRRFYYWCQRGTEGPNVRNYFAWADEFWTQPLRNLP